jgi:hypothetical protein
VFTVNAQMTSRTRAMMDAAQNTATRSSPTWPTLRFRTLRHITSMGRGCLTASELESSHTYAGGRLGWRTPRRSLRRSRSPAPQPRRLPVEPSATYLGRYTPRKGFTSLRDPAHWQTTRLLSGIASPSVELPPVNRRPEGHHPFRLVLSIALNRRRRPKQRCASRARIRPPRQHSDRAGVSEQAKRSATGQQRSQPPRWPVPKRPAS